MNFSQILEELKNDKKVRLPNWEPGDFIEIQCRGEEPTLIKVDRGGHSVYRPSMTAIFALNWEVC